MAEVTVSQFAEVLKVPVERLITQLDEAGIKVSGADDIISDEAKMELLTHLRRAHGREEDAAAAPRKITLKRKAQQEIKVASTLGRARTVNVEVRVKKTYLNRTVLEEEQRQRQEEVDRARQAEESVRLEAERREAELRDAERLERERLEREAQARVDEEARLRAEAEAQHQAEKSEHVRHEKTEPVVEPSAAEPVRAAPPP
ncbi:MAG: translation initiation factor IF-2, partial [Desulfobacteraceae bacterium]